MANEYYSKFINFLKKYNIYDEATFNYFWDHSVYADYRDTNFKGMFGCCKLIFNCDDNISEFVPYIPFLVDDKTVVINIYTYVHSLILMPQIGKKYAKNEYYEYLLPLFYETLYVKENQTPELLKYEEVIRNNFLKNNSLDYKMIFDFVDQLILEYKKRYYSQEKISKRAKKLAKSCIKNTKK